MQTVLLVDNDKTCQMLVEHALHPLGCQLLTVSTAIEAKKLLAQTKISVILLDISLPDESGLELLSDFKTELPANSVHVILLTGKRGISDEVTAFSLGAEDYIVKPFNPIDLRVRVEAKLRSVAESEDVSRTLSLGHLKIGFGSQRVFITQPGQEEILIPLATMEFRLLAYLARFPEQIFSREQLLSAVWGNTADVFDRTVDAHICILRKKLGPCSRYIESVRNAGYRFTLQYMNDSALLKKVV